MLRYKQAIEPRRCTKHTIHALTDRIGCRRVARLLLARTGDPSPRAANRAFKYVLRQFRNRIRLFRLAIVSTEGDSRLITRSGEKFLFSGQDRRPVAAAPSRRAGPVLADAAGGRPGDGAQHKARRPRSNPHPVTGPAHLRHGVTRPWLVPCPPSPPPTLSKVPATTQGRYRVPCGITLRVSLDHWRPPREAAPTRTNPRCDRPSCRWER